MFRTKIIDSYQLQTYERTEDAVNEFCAAHDVVTVKHDVKKDDIIYSIVFRAEEKSGLTSELADLTAPASTINKYSEALSVFKEYIVERGTESSSLSFPEFCIQHGAVR
jgi:hypothetical protein